MSSTDKAQAKEAAKQPKAKKEKKDKKGGDSGKADKEVENPNYRGLSALLKSRFFVIPSFDIYGGFFIL